jgi:hypothetical protein
MGSILSTASSAFRDYNTDGVPASGAHNPVKREIRNLFSIVDQLSVSSTGGGAAFTTKAQADANLAYAALSMASVVADNNPTLNGIYQKQGASGTGSWLRIADLPNEVISLQASGGSANVITATAFPQAPVTPQSKLFILTPASANTGPVTLAVPGISAGAALEVRNAFDAPLAANSLLPGSQILMAWRSGHYQILVSASVDADAILANVVSARDDAEDARDQAEAAVALIANQVSQFETRASAAATTIPAGVNSIRIVRYATGHPISNAFYVPGTSTGPLAFQEASGAWWQLDISGSLSAMSCGATGDGITNDFAAITSAIALAVAFSKSLYFPDGVYCHGSTIEWNKANNTRVFGGKRVTFKHTGTGVAHSFSGITTAGSGDGFKRNSWFWGDRATVQGNPAGGTTIGVYINNWHWSYMQVKIRDCATAFKGENTGAPSAAAAVESVFDVYVSPAGGETFNVACGYGMYLDLFAACTFINPTIEVCGSGNVFAVLLTNNSNGNLFLGGTFESNIYGGCIIGSTSERNTFINTHCEVHGYRDWQIDGNQNTFINIAGAASTSGQGCSGSYNTFQGATLQSMSVAGVRNTFQNCNFLVGFTNGGTDTTMSNSRGGIGGTGDKLPVPGRQAFSFSAGFSSTGTPYENCGYWFNPDYFVHFAGVLTCGTVSGPTTIATLPSGYRPLGKVLMTCYNLSTDAVCAITIDVNGLVQTRAGVSTGNILSLSDVSYRIA